MPDLTDLSMYFTQVRSAAAADLKNREKTHANTGARKFSFNDYMMRRAELVNEALDRAVPLQYPEAVTEAMR